MAEQKTGHTFRNALIFAVAIAAAIFAYKRWNQKPTEVDLVEDFQFPDLNTDNTAAKGEYMKAPVWTRAATKDDLGTAEMAQVPEDAAQASGAGWRQIQDPKETFLTGTLFHLPEKTMLQMVTAAAWIIVLDGEGEMVFEDARTNQDRSVHAVYWYLKRGTFRAKPHDYGKGKYWLRVRTPRGKVEVLDSEFGLRTGGGGGGQVWSVKGEATLYKADGTVQILKEKEMGYL